MLPAASLLLLAIAAAYALVGPGDVFGVGRTFVAIGFAGTGILGLLTGLLLLEEEKEEEAAAANFSREDSHAVTFLDTSDRVSGIAIPPKPPARKP